VNLVSALSLAGSPAWTQLIPVGTPPSGREGHTAIYDPVDDRMVVFGGWDGFNKLNDVWALSLAGSPSWTQLIPMGISPRIRYWHTAIYDPVRNRMMVFGGFGSYILNDVWDLQWDTPVSVLPREGDDALWLAPPYPNPSRSEVAIGFTLPRASAATLRIYDVSGRLVRTLVGGTLPAGSRVCRWDGRSASRLPALYRA